MVVDRIRSAVCWYLAPYTEGAIPSFQMCARPFWVLARLTQQADADADADADSDSAVADANAVQLTD